MKNENDIYVTSPAMPPIEKFFDIMKDIWDSKQLTNVGKYHRRFEKNLCDYLGVSHCNLVTNGTLAIILSLQALRITGEVITTPFSFPASTHALYWNGIKPVFCDIEYKTLNLDPNRIESLITPKTTAILPVHVYGHPCDVNKIKEIAEVYGLHVIYDAAHAFGVEINGESILNYGDISILSFHATKIFNTMEGGAIITRDEKIKRRIDFLKNFGFADEVTIIGPGINAKMCEVLAAYGLLELEIIDEEIKKREKISRCYKKRLVEIPGITNFGDIDGVKPNYSYYPILIHQDQFGKSRDEVYEELKKHRIHSRRYFFPLISQFPTYRSLPSAARDNLPVAEKITKEILCLPIYGDLDIKQVDKICQIIIKMSKS